MKGRDKNKTKQNKRSLTQGQDAKAGGCVSGVNVGYVCWKRCWNAKKLHDINFSFGVCEAVVKWCGWSEATKSLVLCVWVPSVGESWHTLLNQMALSTNALKNRRTMVQGVHTHKKVHVWLWLYCICVAVNMTCLLLTEITPTLHSWHWFMCGLYGNTQGFRGILLFLTTVC